MKYTEALRKFFEVLDEIEDSNLDISEVRFDKFDDSFQVIDSNGFIHLCFGKPEQPVDSFKHISNSVCLKKYDEGYSNGVKAGMIQSLDNLLDILEGWQFSSSVISCNSVIKAIQTRKELIESEW